MNSTLGLPKSAPPGYDSPAVTTAEQMAAYRVHQPTFRAPATVRDCEERMQTGANALRGHQHFIEVHGGEHTSELARRKAEWAVLCREQAALKAWMRDHRLQRKEPSEKRQIRVVVGKLFDRTATLVQVLRDAPGGLNGRQLAVLADVETMIAQVRRKLPADDGQETNDGSR